MPNPAGGERLAKGLGDPHLYQVVAERIIELTLDPDALERRDIRPRASGTSLAGLPAPMPGSRNQSLGVPHARGHVNPDRKRCRLCFENFSQSALELASGFGYDAETILRKLD